MRSLPFALVLTASMFTSACAPFIHSPPARLLTLEPAKTLRPGETGLQLEGGGAAEEDIGVSSASARVHHGLAHDVEISTEATFMRFNHDPDAHVSGRDNIYLARFGAKYSPFDWMAVTAGLGGGGWTGGGFLTTDVGMIFGYENRFFVPFVPIGFWSSHPLSANTLTIDGDDEGDNAPDLIGNPDTTVGWYIGIGGRIPLTHEKNEKTKSAILLGLRFTDAYHDEPVVGRTANFYTAFSLGIDIVFN